jgi:formyltetrahydrofolate deformylase
MFDHKQEGRLLLCCLDRPGIVAAVTQFLFSKNANILALDQYADDQTPSHLFLRVSFHALDASFHHNQNQWKKQFQDQVANSFQMQFHFRSSQHIKSMVILVSKADHALLDLIWRYRRGELETCVKAVISNHPDLADEVAHWGIPFHHVPIDNSQLELAEQRMGQLIQSYEADLIVLARYMRVLSKQLVEPYKNRIINIHHSFLPAFVGAEPYRQAYEKGVKLIGATAHYVTEDLDMGPIIAQDTVAITHKDTVETLKNKGKDIERRVLVQAVKWHLQDRILVNNDKTIIFD